MLAESNGVSDLQRSPLDDKEEPPQGAPHAARVTVTGTMVRQPIVDELTAPRRKFCRFGLRAAGEEYPMVAYGQAAEAMGRIRTQQSVRVEGQLLVHRWKTRGNVEHMRFEIDVLAVEIR